MKSVFLLVLIGVTAANAGIVPKREASFEKSETAKNGNGRIVGGETAYPGQFPYQAALRLLSYHICGGSIIADRWVLSTTSCSNGWAVQYLRIVVGAHHIETDGTEYLIERIIEHPDYDDDILENNIALIKTENALVFSESVAAIPLNSNQIGAGVSVQASGWGTTSVSNVQMVYFYCKSFHFYSF